MPDERQPHRSTPAALAPGPAVLEQASPEEPHADVSGTAEPQAPLAGLARALATVGDRWSLAIVACLLGGPARFGSLQRELREISPNILSQRLRALQSDGVVLARPYSRRPLRCSYELTESGQELAGPSRLLGDWGARRGGAQPPALQHAACGTPLEVRWYCPTCEEAVSAPTGAAEELYFA